MSSIRESLVALDTNQFIVAVRRDSSFPSCQALIYDKLHLLDALIPDEVLAELRRNLSDLEVRGISSVLSRARSTVFDDESASPGQIRAWEARGAKKGDGLIAATLERANVGFFVSENRHFLREIDDFPFRVVTSEEAVNLLDAE